MSPDSSPSDEILRFEEQVQRQPDSLVFARLADAYRKAGQPERALAVLEDGLLRHPEYASGHIVRARALRDLGRVEETLEAFRRVLELDASNLVAVTELAGLADERGDVAEARHWYEQLVQMDPTDTEWRRRLEDLESESLGAETSSRDRPGPETQAWWSDSAVDLSEGGADTWWNDSAPGPLDLTDAGELADVVEEADPGEEGEIEIAGEDERRPEDEVVEAILNGDVPQTVKAEETWWYEDATEPSEPEPSRDADLLTRTMADLYAEQGLDREAAEIYEELLKDSPGDPELLARLDAVRQKTPASPVGSEVGSPAPEPPGELEPHPVDDGIYPISVGRPAGLPVAEELRRLLRTGEERARALPDPEQQATAPPEELAPESDSTSLRHETVESERSLPEPGNDEAGGFDAEGPSSLALDWIEGLKADQ